MSFPRYPAYKDSGVEWLGEVPEHWAVLPLKRRIARIESGTSVNAIDVPASDGEYGVLKTSCVYTGEFDANENKAIVPEEYGRATCPLRSGALIVSRMNTPDLVGAAGLVHEGSERIFLPDRLWQIQFSELDPRFVHRWTQSGLYRAQVQAACAGTSASMQNLAQDQFGAFLLAAPPAGEQATIATFLDRETAKIDALVAEQEKLIALLQEKRQAVISHAVTKGLDPNVPMKDSGVEWLGEVPAHWECGALKRWISTTSGGTPDTARQDLYYSEVGGHPWIRTTDLNDDVLSHFEISITDRALVDTNCALLPAGSILVAMYGGDGTIGKNALLAIDACVNQALCALLPSAHLEPRFVLRYVQFYRPHWMIGAESSRKDPNISQALIRNTPLVCPPLHEQRAIADFLDREAAKIDALVAEAEGTIDLLKERRAALISAAVIGQIDVRGRVVASREGGATAESHP